MIRRIKKEEYAKYNIDGFYIGDTVITKNGDNHKIVGLDVEKGSNMTNILLDGYYNDKVEISALKKSYCDIVYSKGANEKEYTMWVDSKCITKEESEIMYKIIKKKNRTKKKNTLHGICLGDHVIVNEKCSYDTSGYDLRVSAIDLDIEDIKSLSIFCTGKEIIGNTSSLPATFDPYLLENGILTKEVEEGDIGIWISPDSISKIIKKEKKVKNKEMK